MDTAAGGSYLVVADGSSTCELLSEACRRYNASGADPYFLRSPEQIARFFAGLELAEPGVVPLPRWRPGPDPSGLPTEAYPYGGIGRKSLGDRPPLLDRQPIGYEVAEHALTVAATRALLGWPAAVANLWAALLFLERSVSAAHMVEAALRAPTPIDGQGNRRAAARLAQRAGWDVPETARQFRRDRAGPLVRVGAAEREPALRRAE